MRLDSRKAPNFAYDGRAMFDLQRRVAGGQIEVGLLDPDGAAQIGFIQIDAAQVCAGQIGIDEDRFL